MERYIDFPTLSNQNMLKFYLLEILNDYIEAINLNKNKALDDEKYQLFHDSYYNRMFGQQPCYVAVEINKELDIEIIRYSKKAQQFFSSLYGLKQKQNISQLLNFYLPEYVEKVHKFLIEQFFNEGTNKYYQQQNLAFLKLSERIMIPTDMLIGINYSQTSAFSFLGFFFETQDIRSFLVVNQNFDIINCSENISQQILINSFSCSSSYMFNKPSYPITNIIQDFEFLLLEQQSYFLNHPIKLGNNKSHLQKFIDHIANLTIEIKFKNEFLCYFITLDNIRINTFRSELKQETILFQRKQTQERSTLYQFDKMNLNIDENIYKNIPYQEIYIQGDQKINILNNNKTTIIDLTIQGESKLETDLLMDQSNQINQRDSRKIFSPKDSIHQQFIKKKESIQNEIIDKISGSSVTQTKKTKFYKKFLIVNMLCKSQQRPKNLIVINLLFTLFTIVMIIQTSFLIFLISNISGFISDIKLLSIRYDVTEPLEAFTVARFTTVNYKEMVGKNIINQTYSEYLQIFPTQTIKLAYNKLKDGLTEVLQRNEIDTLTQINTLPIMLYINANNTGAQKIVSIRTLISLTLNYEHDFLLNIIGDTVQNFDNPYFYFSYKDYVIVKSVFDNLNTIILQITLTRTSEEQEKWMYCLIPFAIINIIISSLLIFNFFQYKHQQNQSIKSMSMIDSEIIQVEKLRLQYLLQIIQTNFESIKQFNFNIEQIDQQLEQSNNIQVQKRQNQNKKNQFKLNNNTPLFGLSFSFLHYVLFLGFAIYIFFIFRMFLNKYKNTAIFYQQLSDIGVDIPSIYAQKEILFRASQKYPFLNTTDIDKIYNIIFKALNAIQNYEQQIQQLQNNDYLFDSNLMDFFNQINTNNLCDYQSEEMKEMTQNFCSQVMQGNLIYGFQQALIYIISFTKIQQQETQNFTIQPLSTLLELEGSTILSNIIEIMKTQFYENLVDITTKLINQYQIFSLIYLIFEGIIILFYYFYIEKYNNESYQLLKQSIYLFPRFTLLFDDSFYRHFGKLIREVEHSS